MTQKNVDRIPNTFVLRIQSVDRISNNFCPVLRMYTNCGQDKKYYCAMNTMYTNYGQE